MLAPTMTDTHPALDRITSEALCFQPTPLIMSSWDCSAGKVASLSLPPIGICMEGEGQRHTSPLDNVIYAFTLFTASDEN